MVLMMGRFWMCRDDIKVSDHALIRYMQRVMELDLSGIYDEILSPQLVASICALGDGKYPLGDGWQVIVHNNTIITVVGR